MDLQPLGPHRCCRLRVLASAVTLGRNRSCSEDRRRSAADSQPKSATKESRFLTCFPSCLVNQVLVDREHAKTVFIVSHESCCIFGYGMFSLVHYVSVG